MDIYSFELTAKEVTWKLFEFKGMMFIGTESYRFPSNRNFIRVDGLVNPSAIKFELGTYYKPAIHINEDCRLKINPYDLNVSFTPGVSDKSSSVAILIVDKSAYRISGEYIKSELEYTPSFFDIVRKVETEEIIVMIMRICNNSPRIIKLYNRMLNRFEVYCIASGVNSDNEHAVVCTPYTEKTMKKALGDVNFKKPDWNLQFHSPVTKCYVTKEEDLDELISILEDAGLNEKSQIISVETDSDRGSTINCILEHSMDAKALTYYKMKPIHAPELDNQFKYNFIMDPTGNIRIE